MRGRSEEGGSAGLLGIAAVLPKGTIHIQYRKPWCRCCCLLLMTGGLGFTCMDGVCRNGDRHI